MIIQIMISFVVILFLITIPNIYFANKFREDIYARAKQIIRIQRENDRRLQTDGPVLPGECPHCKGDWIVYTDGWRTYQCKQCRCIWVWRLKLSAKSVTCISTEQPDEEPEDVIFRTMKSGGRM